MLPIVLCGLISTYFHVTVAASHDRIRRTSPETPNLGSWNTLRPALSHCMEGPKLHHYTSSSPSTHLFTHVSYLYERSCLESTKVTHATQNNSSTTLTTTAAKERLQKVAGQLAPTEGDMDGKSASGGRGRASVLSKNPDDVRLTRTSRSAPPRRCSHSHERAGRHHVRPAQRAHQGRQLSLIHI